MKKFLFTLLIVSTVFILGFGKWQYDQNIKNTGLKTYKAYEKQQQEELQKEQQKLALLEKNQSNSVIDWLEYKSTQKDKIAISVFGSSVTVGAGASAPEKTWAYLLKNYLNNQEDISSISLTNRGYGGYSTDRLISEKKINEVLADKPDLVILEPTIINNSNGVSVEQTKDDVLYFVNEIKKNLPETLIIIQSSNPISFAPTNKWVNSYEDYVNSLSTLTRSNKLNYIDIYSGVEKLRKDNKKLLKDILSDDRHPNDLGYEYWFETLKTSFEKVKLK